MPLPLYHWNVDLESAGFARGQMKSCDWLLNFIQGRENSIIMTVNRLCLDNVKRKKLLLLGKFSSFRKMIELFALCDPFQFMTDKFVSFFSERFAELFKISGPNAYLIKEKYPIICYGLKKIISGERIQKVSLLPYNRVILTCSLSKKANELIFITNNTPLTPTVYFDATPNCAQINDIEILSPNYSSLCESDLVIIGTDNSQTVAEILNNIIPTKASVLYYSEVFDVLFSYFMPEVSDILEAKVNQYFGLEN